MKKSVENDCLSLNSSSPSETSPERESSKSTDTVSKLFSNLFKKSESTSNLNASFISVSQTRSSDNPPTVEKIYISAPNLKTDDLNVKNPVIPDDIPIIEKLTETSKCKSSDEETQPLALSTNTIVLDHPKNVCTSHTSRIPILNSRFDDMQSFEDDRKSSNASASVKGLNSHNVSRKSSTSRIPISTKRFYHEVQNRYTPPQQNYYRPPTQNIIRKQPSQNPTTGKYNHIKSKLAAYIHRPMKSDFRINRRPLSMSPVDRKKPDICPLYSTVKSTTSRTSLDTFTPCEYKTPMSDLGCFDYEKFDDFNVPSEKIRKHFELAAEYSKMKLEKERIIAKEQQSALEHSERANDCMQKAIALLLNKLTEKS